MIGLKEGFPLTTPELPGEVADLIRRIAKGDDVLATAAIEAAFEEGLGAIGTVITKELHLPVLPMSSRDRANRLSGWHVVNRDPDGGAETVVPIQTQNPPMAIQEGLLGARDEPRQRHVWREPIVPALPTAPFRLGTHGSSPDNATVRGYTLRVDSDHDAALRQAIDADPKTVMGWVDLVAIPPENERQPLGGEPGRIAVTDSVRTLGRIPLFAPHYLEVGPVDLFSYLPKAA